ncbi:hypothetical protein OAG39_02520 [Verrucomicrobiales bacterium]|nr:hypothetical protein [Verrucomicrobiales bacterium]
MLIEIKVPKLNASDNSIKIVKVFVSNGIFVEIGEVLFEYETSKASFEFVAENDGYLYHRLRSEDIVAVGSRVACISQIKIDPDKEQELFDVQNDSNENKKVITKKAKLLIDNNKLDVELFEEELITEKIVKKYLIKNKKINTSKREKCNFNTEDVVIMGIGGHAGICIDILKSSTDYNLAGFIDEYIDSDEKYGLKSFGKLDDLDYLIDSGLQNLILGIGFIDDLDKRDKYYQELATKIEIPTIIHKSAIIEDSSKISTGCQIMAGAIIGSNVTINENCIINSGSIISHDSFINKSTHITPGAVLAGGVTVGEKCTIGMCSTIYIGCNIPNGTTIKNNQNVIN